MVQPQIIYYKIIRYYLSSHLVKHFIHRVPLIRMHLFILYETIQSHSQILMDIASLPMQGPRRATHTYSHINSGVILSPTWSGSIYRANSPLSMPRRMPTLWVLLNLELKQLFSSSCRLRRKISPPNLSLHKAINWVGFQSAMQLNILILFHYLWDQ